MRQAHSEFHNFRMNLVPSKQHKPQEARDSRRRRPNTSGLEHKYKYTFANASGYVGKRFGVPFA